MPFVTSCNSTTQECQCTGQYPNLCCSLSLISCWKNCSWSQLILILNGVLFLDSKRIAASPPNGSVRKRVVIEIIKINTNILFTQHKLLLTILLRKPTDVQCIFLFQTQLVPAPVTSATVTLSSPPVCGVNQYTVCSWTMIGPSVNSLLPDSWFGTDFVPQ